MWTASWFLALQMTVAVEPTARPTVTAQEVARGKTLFEAQCAYCHGADGDGGRGANLARAALRRAPTDEALFRVVNRGIPGTGMPGNAMSARETWQVVAFVRTLGRVKREPLPRRCRARRAGLRGCRLRSVPHHPWTRRSHRSGLDGHRRPLEPGLPSPGDCRSAGRRAERVQANPGRDTRGPAPDRRPRQRRHVLDPVPRCRRDPALLLQGGIGGARRGRRKNGDAEFSRASRTSRAR